MTDEEFEKLVWEGVEAIPEHFKKKLENVAFFIADSPSPEQRAEVGLGPDDVLYGLYEGVPHTERDTHYQLALPDRITIFKEAFLPLMHDPERVRQEIADTIYHEIGHHFGLEEDEVEAREAQRRKKRGQA